MKNNVTATSSLMRSTRAGNPAVERHEAHQEQRLARSGVDAHFGATARNQWPAHDLDDRITHEDQKDITSMRRAAMPSPEA